MKEAGQQVCDNAMIRLAKQTSPQDSHGESSEKCKSKNQRFASGDEMTRVMELLESAEKRLIDIEERRGIRNTDHLKLQFDQLQLEREMHHDLKELEKRRFNLEERRIELDGRPYQGQSI